MKKSQNPQKQKKKKFKKKKNKEKRGERKETLTSQTIHYLIATPDNQ